MPPPPAPGPAKRNPAQATPPTTPRSRPGHGGASPGGGAAAAAGPGGAASRPYGAAQGSSPWPSPPASPRGAGSGA
eukprot:4097917-Lingulodinium_polyedra.AAC.1